MVHSDGRAHNTRQFVAARRRNGSSPIENGAPPLALAAHDWLGNPAMALEAIAHSAVSERSAPTNDLSRASRLDQLIRENFDFVWRLARHLGLSREDADDVAQRVMLVAANRFDDIEPGKARAFLFSATKHATLKFRRGWGRRREVVTDKFPDEVAPHAQPDELLDQRRAYAELRRVLQRVPEKPRTVFVLYELEGWTLSEIGQALGLAHGTVASRLRRARSDFLRYSVGIQKKMTESLP